MLEAICTYREQLGGVIMMYAPAHRGGWANAVADAAAKAGLTSERGDISGMIEQGIEWRPTVTTVEGEGGKQEIWDKGAYEMMREGTGWWIGSRNTGGSGLRQGPEWWKRQD